MIRMTRQRWLVLFVVTVAVVAHLSGASSFLTWESLKTHRNSLQVLVQNHSIEAPILFVLLYAVLVALALPGATIMTLAAGIIFTQPWSTIVSVLGAATGACCNYYLSTCAFKSEDDGNAIRNQLGLETKDQKQGEKRFANGVGMFYGLISWKKIAKGIKENEAVYMLLLRLVPIFPFWFVNIAPSVLGVKFSTFAWTTYVGIIPGSFVYTQCGFGLASMMEEDLKDETLMSFLFKGIFNKHTAGGLVLLFLWLCFLLVLRWWVSKRTKERKLRMKAEKKATKQQKKQEKVLMKLSSDKERNDNNNNNKQTAKTIVRKRIETDFLDDEGTSKHKKYGRGEVDLGELEHDSSSEGESGEDVKEEMLEVREGEK